MDAHVIGEHLKDLNQSVDFAKLTKTSFDSIEEAAVFLENKQYFKAAETLKSFKVITNNLCLEEEDEDTRRSIDAIQKEHDSILQKLVYVLGKEWDDNIKIIPNFKEGVKDQLQSSKGIYNDQMEFIRLTITNSNI